MFETKCVETLVQRSFGAQATKSLYRILTKFESKGTSDRRSHNLRMDHKRTKAFLAGLKKFSKADPNQVMANWLKTQCDSPNHESSRRQ